MGGGMGYTIVSGSGSAAKRRNWKSGTACYPTENISSMVENAKSRQLEMYKAEGDARGEALRK
jgi:hypothetical protein